MELNKMNELFDNRIRILKLLKVIVSEEEFKELLWDLDKVILKWREKKSLGIRWKKYMR